MVLMYPSATCHDLAAEIPIIEGTFAKILDAALDANGDISGLETARLSSII